MKTRLESAADPIEVRLPRRSRTAARNGYDSASTATRRRRTADDEVRRFLHAIDALGELLTPSRRPQDRDEPECSRTELRILSALGRTQPVTMTALAGALRIPLSTATRAVDKLVAKRFVERRRSARDRRLVQVVFSPRGRRINRYVARTRAAMASALLGRLGSVELARTVASLARLTGRSST